MNSRRHLAWVRVLAMVFLGVQSMPVPAASELAQPVKRAHYIMGTIFEITAFGPDRESTAAAIEEAFAAIRHADEVMSHYKPESDLMRLNREGADGPVRVPVGLYYALAESLKYSALSGGAFDITVGPLVRLWDRSAEENRLPTESEMAEARAVVGAANVQLLIPAAGELPGARVQFARGGVEVNLGAIGKGWAVDRAVEILRSHGIQNAFVSAGTSTLYALGGGPEGDGWHVGIRNPCSPEETLEEMRISDLSVSTSAGYERYWEIDGQRYSHILDPRTGWPVEPLASVTVITASATRSDALSTAAYVLGGVEGKKLLDRLAGNEFIISLLVEATEQDGCRVHRVGRPAGRVIKIASREGEDGNGD